MKKNLILVIICILFIPIVVNAEECNSSSIKIESISIKDKSKYVEELSNATFKDNKLNLDIKMYDIKDYINYELIVKNESNEDFFFDENSLNINSNYFDYSISYKDNSNKIKADAKKTIYLKIQYKKEVESDKYFSGKYIDTNNLIVNLSNTNQIFINPLTKNNSINLLLGIVLIVQVLLFFSWTKKKGTSYMLLLGLALLIPINTYALCKCRLDIDSNITIGKVKPNPCTYNGELVQGAEYVNGQYTYRYMQENFDYYEWLNISNDGWGVRLTNKESTDDVTTKLCTSINDKPIVSMNSMFFESKASNIDLSSFDTSNVVSMQTMFYYVKNIRNYDLSSFDTSNVSKMGAMFYGNDSLEKINLNTFDISSLESSSTLLAFNRNLKKVNIDNWDFSNKSNITSVIGGMFSASDNIEDISMKN